MLVQNCQMMICPFEEYLELPGWSHSSLKHEGKEWSAPTEKMQLGTHVHNYLLTPEEYRHNDIEVVRPLAVELKRVLGPLLPFLIPEIAITADFIHEGFCMKYKGRVDLGIPGKIVIDLKVSDLDPLKSMQYFRYDRPITGYCAALGTETALLLTINPKKKTTSLKKVPLEYIWWEEQILKKGDPIL